MFCSKCAKEIADEAMICPACGCATANFYISQNQKNAANNTYSDDYLAIKEFERKVKGLHTTSVIAFVLFLGIGLIFSLAAWIAAKSITIPGIKTTNPNEIHIFEVSKKKLNSALNFSCIPLYVLLLLSAAAAFAGNWAVVILFFVLYIVLLLIYTACTKHLWQKKK